MYNGLTGWAAHTRQGFLLIMYQNMVCHTIVLQFYDSVFIYPDSLSGLFYWKIRCNFLLYQFLCVYQENEFTRKETKMEITGSIKEVRAQVKEWRKQGLTVGLVPTMGYLHEGHKSLIDRAVLENDKVVVSDFVNPIQFGVNEDLSTYPRDIEADKKLCEAAGAALIFHPEPEEMYAPDFSTYVETEHVSAGLCGKTRPTHFRGVCTVVSKLFNIVAPDKAYFGQKDAQQLAVIRRMVRDLNMDIEIIGCPIIREADGLAKSSRNTYLSPEERKAALVLSKAVFRGEEMVKNGEKKADVILTEMKQIIEAEPLAKIDYVEMVDADSIETVEEVKGRVLVAMAVYIGKTRLIDNFIV